MAQSPGEWFRQADYDMDTAQAMLDAGRYIYTVFMCHLSIEKALKGIYVAKLKQVPPKTHNLGFLLGRVELAATDAQRNFLADLSRASVGTRYPDMLTGLVSQFTKQKSCSVLDEAKGVLEWLKSELAKCSVS